MRNVLFWAIFPFLLPQALYVRKSARRFAPAGGPLEGSVGAGKHTRMLAVGDSIIVGVGASELSKALVGRTAEAIAKSENRCVSWHAFGVSGYNSTKILERLVPKLPDVAVDYIIVSVGVNDVTGLTTIRKWRQNLVLLLDKLQAHSPNAVIAVAGMPPLQVFPLLPQPLRAVLGMRGRSLDDVSRKVLDRYKNSIHVPLEFETDPRRFAPDGYHPSEEGYAEFGRHIAERLLALDALTRGA